MALTTTVTLEMAPVAEPEVEETSFEAVYLEPHQVRFRYENDNLTLTYADGTFYPRVTLRRCFPFSTNETFVTVKTPDTEKERGRELGIVTAFEQLDPDSQAAISNELKQHYFVPIIKKIIKIHEEYGFLYWNVLTDRGEKEFIMRDNVVSTARQITPTQWLLIDINQARYEVNNNNDLDPHSQKLLVRYLLL